LIWIDRVTELNFYARNQHFGAREQYFNAFLLCPPQTDFTLSVSGIYTPSSYAIASAFVTTMAGRSADHRYSGAGRAAGKPALLADHSKLLVTIPKLSAAIPKLLADHSTLLVVISNVLVSISKVLADHSTLFVTISTLLVTISKLLAVISKVLVTISKLLYAQRRAVIH